MPTYDGGHYFLTVLVPIQTKPVNDGQVVTSPVHALRKRLSLLPTADETPACGGGQSPFARNTRNHFARFAVIDDVAYVGRSGRDVLAGTIAGDNPAAAQPQDNLSCPFLLFSADPCVAVIPILFAAAPLGVLRTLFVVCAYELATIVTMVVLVLPARAAANRVDAHPVRRTGRRSSLARVMDEPYAFGASPTIRRGNPHTQPGGMGRTRR